MFGVGLTVGILLGVGGLLMALFVAGHGSPEHRDITFETWCKEHLPALSDNEHEAVITALYQLLNIGVLKWPAQNLLPNEMVSRKFRRALDK